MAYIHENRHLIKDENISEPDDQGGQPGRVVMDFTHLDKNGNANMVDVGDKPVTRRTAVAEGVIRMSKECFDMIKAGTHKKGDVISTARIAGIMGAKRTSDLIPLCHNITLNKIGIEFEEQEESSSVKAVCTVICDGKTGAEMEALTGVNIALLTVYDMCKAVDKAMIIEGIRLVEKHGGQSEGYA